MDVFGATRRGRHHTPARELGRSCQTGTWGTQLMSFWSFPCPVFFQGLFGLGDGEKMLKIIAALAVGDKKSVDSSSMKTEDQTMRHRALGDLPGQDGFVRGDPTGASSGWMCSGRPDGGVTWHSFRQV